MTIIESIWSYNIVKNEDGFYGITDKWDYPQIPKEKRHTSILANPDFDYPTCTLCIGKDGESDIQRCTRDFSHSRFDFIRSEIENIFIASIALTNR